MIECYSDGCAKNNGKNGPGGWSAIIYHGGMITFLGGYVPSCTNNQTELIGAIRAMQRALEYGEKIKLFSDSRYVVDGTNTWIYNWKRTGWKTAGKTPVKNSGLWKTILSLKEKGKITAKWVKGHNGHTQNELCDSIANYCTLNKCFLNETFIDCPEALSTIVVANHIVYSDPFEVTPINRAGKLLEQNFFEQIE